VKLFNKLQFLIKHLYWLECLLVPLLYSNSKLKMAKTFKYINELLQCGVTLLVKSAIREELIN